MGYAIGAVCFQVICILIPNSYYGTNPPRTTEVSHRPLIELNLNAWNYRVPNHQAKQPASHPSIHPPKTVRRNSSTIYGATARMLKTPGIMCLKKGRNHRN
jgi:hypothetical protein